MFVPSFSPENNPGNLTPSMMLVIVASMDIAVCREALSNLVQASELLGADAHSVPKWQGDAGEVRYSHRHISHLYGAWPGDEIDPDRTPQLARAAMIADRKRAPERLHHGTQFPGKRRHL